MNYLSGIRNNWDWILGLLVVGCFAFVVGTHVGLGNRFYREIDRPNSEGLLRSLNSVTEMLKEDDTERLAVIVITAYGIYQSKRINEDHDLIIALYNKKSGHVLSQYGLEAIMQ